MKAIAHNTLRIVSSALLVIGPCLVCPGNQDGQPPLAPPPGKVNLGAASNVESAPDVLEEASLPYATSGLSDDALTPAVGHEASRTSADGATAYSGLCDASAVVALDAETFAVADDEDNVIRVYRRGAGGRPVHSLELSSFLRVSSKAPEVDIEGAARLGGLVYWISSHGRNAKGKPAPNRQRFFATTGSVSNGAVELRPIGQPYMGLLRDLLQEPRLAGFDLQTASARAPKSPGALNIEGLVATPDGHLLIGFRNPLPHGRALLVPLLNPAELIQGGRARLGDPILLDLQGQGIRSLTRWHDQFLIIAGSYTGEGVSRLLFWDGFSPPQALEGTDFSLLNPESASGWTGSSLDRLFVVSDDGRLKWAGIECKKLPFAGLKKFRVLDFDLSTPASAQP